MRLLKVKLKASAPFIKTKVLHLEVMPFDKSLSKLENTQLPFNLSAVF